MFRMYLLRRRSVACRPLLAIATAGLFCFMASAGAEVRSYDGGVRTAIPAVDDWNAKGGNGNSAIRPVAHYEGATRWGLAGVNPAGFVDRAASLHSQMLPETTGSTAVNVNDRFLGEKAFAAGQASPVTYMARLNPYGPFANTMFFLQAANACDLNNDGTVNNSDVDLATNMSLGLSACTAAILGAGVCNVMVVQRIINASMGGACVTGSSHTVSLSWVASTSPNVAGYSVYRGTTSGGPYTKLNSSLATGTSFVDGAVQAGQTYYYVVTAVDTSNNSSVYSNVAQAVVPSP